MIIFKVINEDYTEHSAFISRRGFRWRGRWTIPVALTAAQLDKAKTVGGTIGGAVIGSILAGGAGMIVGALAGGNKGKTLFVLQTIEGNELLCRCPTKQFSRICGLMPIFIQRVTELKNLQLKGEFWKDGLLISFIYALIGGPFYFGRRYGVLAFILTTLALFPSSFTSWLIMPFVELLLHRRERKHWLAQYGDHLRCLDVKALRAERRQGFATEHGWERALEL